MGTSGSSADDQLVLTIFCTPNAGKSAIVGTKGGALWIKIQAPAQDGRANEALIRYIAQYFSCRIKDIQLLGSGKSRFKRLRFLGLAATHLAQIRARIASLADCN